MILDRDRFRESVFSRDEYKCVFCGEPAVDAHHIMERRLWTSGGYFADNGASVCEKHHLECEMTLISTDDVRKACGITRVYIPEHLYDDNVYDKWGNIVLPTGIRIKGELFFDESVQKILERGGVLDRFSNLVKYPRTYHLPWSEGMNDDDRMMRSLEGFIGKRVIATEKMDGENTTMYRDDFHARSLDSQHNFTRDWAKNFWSQIRYDIPEGWRICCENMYAKHSLAYDNLSTYVLGFSIWNERNECLPWDETLVWFELLGITPVPTMYDGIFDERIIRKLYDTKRDWHHKEGYVLRTADGFNYGMFRGCVGKYVRKDHVNTVKHWLLGGHIEKNGLKG